jgi:opacity protein-like surface antigen
MKKRLVLITTSLIAFSSSFVSLADQYDWNYKSKHEKRTPVGNKEFLDPDSSSNRVSSPFKGFYLKGELGYSHSLPRSFSYNSTPITAKADKQLGAGFGLGYNLTENFKADLTFNKLGTSQWSYNNLNAKVSVNTIMFRGTYKFYVGHPSISPFIALGAGLAKDTRKELKNITQTTQSATNFCWDVGLGIALPINNNLSAELTYRYTNAGKTVVNVGQYIYNNFMIGLSYDFN